ncbi:MAG TPA: FeoB-associated Cys-rich membrane protein [Crocinitomix sp.]|nr:FeoB-associated Cys-rich membrane protein [Crocinitomix sp.]
MDGDSIFVYVNICVCSIIFSLSIFKLMQHIFVYILFVLAVGYFIYKFFVKKKNNNSCNNGSCGCS